MGDNTILLTGLPVGNACQVHFKPVTQITKTSKHSVHAGKVHTLTQKVSNFTKGVMLKKSSQAENCRCTNNPSQKSNDANNLQNRNRTIHKSPQIARFASRTISPISHQQSMDIGSVKHPSAVRCKHG